MRLDVLDIRDVDALTLDLIPAHIQRAMAVQLAEVVSDFGDWELRRLGSASLFRASTGAAVSFLSRFIASRSYSINFTTRRRVRQILAEGAVAGEGLRSMTRRVRDVFRDAKINRARLIARTEANAAANFGVFEAQVQSGIVKKRKWVAVLDAVVRDSHAALNGQTRGMKEPFESGGKRAMYPGGFSDAAENINCRCTTVAVRAKKDAITDADTRHQRSFVIREIQWEERLEQTLVRAFRTQERILLGRLRQLDRSQDLF